MHVRLFWKWYYTIVINHDIWDLGIVRNISICESASQVQQDFAENSTYLI